MMMMKAQNMKRTMTKIAEKANCNQFWNQGGGVNENRNINNTKQMMK